MKLVFVFAFVAAAFAAPQLRATERPIAILRQDNDVYPDGSYRYNFETENGIIVEEQGQQKVIGTNSGNAAQGFFQFTSPEGKLVLIQYIADENGFQPTGDAIPTVPPAPGNSQSRNY